jgi:hypothetical protein
LVGCPMRKWKPYGNHWETRKPEWKPTTKHMDTMETIKRKKIVLYIFFLFIVSMVSMCFVVGFHSGFRVSQQFPLQFPLRVKSSCENRVRYHKHNVEASVPYSVTHTIERHTVFLADAHVYIYISVYL